MVFEAVATRPARKSAPVKVFAALGALWLVFIGITWTRWCLSADFVPSPVGPDQVSGAKQTFYWLWQAGNVALMIGLGGY